MSTAQKCLLFCLLSFKGLAVFRDFISPRRWPWGVPVLYRCGRTFWGCLRLETRWLWSHTWDAV